LGGRGRQISEFQASLVYKVSSRTARATQRNPVSKNKKREEKRREEKRREEKRREEKRREEKRREEKRRERERRREVAWVWYGLSKPENTLPPVRPHLLTLLILAKSVTPLSQSI
jgi:hypothetical protein